MLGPLLCGWYVYMVVLAGLMTASAGWRSPGGKLSALATLGSAALLLTLLGWTPDAAVTLAIKGGVLVVAALMLVAGPRQDTRLIALLLAGAALLPVVLHFYEPASGPVG